MIAATVAMTVAVRVPRMPACSLPAAGLLRPSPFLAQKTEGKTFLPSFLSGIHGRIISCLSFLLPFLSPRAPSSLATVPDDRGRDRYDDRDRGRDRDYESRGSDRYDDRRGDGKQEQAHAVPHACTESVLNTRGRDRPFTDGRRDRDRDEDRGGGRDHEDRRADGDGGR